MEGMGIRFWLLYWGSKCYPVGSIISRIQYCLMLPRLYYTAQLSLQNLTTPKSGVYWVKSQQQIVLH